ncbi:glycine cleavage system aminomethyltransferase GcvT [Candidatus Parvarchaeota archaeon]|nr:glycine cleavage system aminomethyltransferase GcvT [Candidatus Parvarchaeota archaeon]
MAELKRTPLFEIHKSLGAKLVDFGGWEMPVQYSGILEEHVAVRASVGIFDVSHMGEVTAKGPQAMAFVQNLVTNDISKAADGQCVYSPMCNPRAGIVDDLLVYKKSNDDLFIVVNASNTEKDFAWMQQNGLGAELKNISDKTGEIALQGPKAQGTLQKITDFDLAALKYFRFSQMNVAGINALVSRTGYTGEDGFEIYCASEDTEKIWGALMEAGAEFAIKPCGLGARDTLRLEAGLMLYGNDITDDVTPYEAPLKWTVKPDKGDFIGKSALLAQKPKRKLVGFELLERAVPRHGNELYVNGEKFDLVTSGTFSPTLKKPIGFCFVPVDMPDGSQVEIKIRDRLYAAKTCSHRFLAKKQ